VLGLRDILDTPEIVAKEWNGLLDLMAGYYDNVLIYGEQALFDPITAYQFPPQVAARTRFCGYVVNREAVPAEAAVGMRLAALRLENRKRPIVLATTGGGEDGFFLLETFMRAAAGAPWQAVVVAGPMTPEPQFQALKSLASEHDVVLHSFMPRLSSLFWSIDALVCMGGYNTLTEAIATGGPIVCVPRTVPRMEQYLRASAFEKHRLLQMVHPENLSAHSLAQSIAIALKTSRQKLLEHSQSILSLDGARHAASHLLALASQATPRLNRVKALSRETPRPAVYS
jgi:predicted glycosyltransferase